MPGQGRPSFCWPPNIATCRRSGKDVHFCIHFVTNPGQSGPALFILQAMPVQMFSFYRQIRHQASDLPAYSADRHAGASHIRERALFESWFDASMMTCPDFSLSRPISKANVEGSSCRHGADRLRRCSTTSHSLG